jgi:hypothetical protein
MTRQITAEQRARSSAWPVAATPESVAETPESAAETAPRDLLRHGHGGILDKIMLLGQPPLHKYLSFVRDQVVDGADFDRGVLMDAWGRANDYYQELEESETGICDEIDVRELDPALAPLAAEVAADPRYHNAFHTLPTAFAMVELDKLVLFQTRVMQQGVDRLRAHLGPAPDSETLFRFCQPQEHHEAPVKIRRVGSDRYVFTSESSDFRPHKPVLLRPDQIRDHESSGPISGVVGLVIGYGSNFLTALRQGEDGRVVLHNGYHRAYTLRALGITHAPCVVRTITRHDQLGIAAAKDVAQDPDFYFASARPPLLKDFFDPKIRKVHQVYKRLKTIEVEFKVREYFVGA